VQAVPGGACERGGGQRVLGGGSEQPDGMPGVRRGQVRTGQRERVVLGMPGGALHQRRAGPERVRGGAHPVAHTAANTKSHDRDAHARADAAANGRAYTEPHASADTIADAFTIAGTHAIADAVTY
jgi:hypothetical protein